MISITKVVEWDMGHRVPQHVNKCKNPHGHRYRLEASIAGDVCQDSSSAEHGMVKDFYEVKQILRKKIHDVLDHNFMIYEGDALMHAFFSSEEAKDLAVTIVPFIPTVENIVMWCYTQLRDEFPPQMRIHKLRLYETPTSWADYWPDTNHVN